MRPNPAIQSRQAHKQRKALGRALHRVLYLREQFMTQYRDWERSPWRNPKPALRISIPKHLRKHKLRLARAFFRA